MRKFLFFLLVLILARSLPRARESDVVPAIFPAINVRESRTLHRPVAAAVETSFKSLKSESNMAEIGEELSKPIEPIQTIQPVRPADAGKSEVEINIETIEALRHEWERQREQIYFQLDVPPEMAAALRDGRERFYLETEEYIAELQSSNISDAEVSSVAARMSQAEQSFDSFVETLLGGERFAILQNALSSFNGQIELQAPVKVRFISSW